MAFFVAANPEMASDIRDRINAWWSAFRAKACDIDALFSRKAQWDLPQWMYENLQQIHPELMWEYGGAVRSQGHRLVITPESRRDLRPLVAEILERAPQIDGWEFYAYRLPEDIEMTVLTVRARTQGEIDDLHFTASLNPLNKIDIVFHSPRHADSPQQVHNDAFVATETLLGEEILDKWIGGIEVTGMPGNGVEHVRELKTKIDSLIVDVHAALPDQPYHRLAEEQKWTLWELSPEQADDYPEQWDLFVGKSMIPAMWQNGHSSQSFDSVRFSQCGEVFCYVKIDGTDGLDEEHFADKGEIEDALDRGLRTDDVGCFVGGGSGLMYSYIDLALTDVDWGVATIRKLLREGKITKRSWILFYDTDLRSQWIGIWEDTPPPPVAVECEPIDS